MYPVPECDTSGWAAVTGLMPNLPAATGQSCLVCGEPSEFAFEFLSAAQDLLVGQRGAGIDVQTMDATDREELVASRGRAVVSAARAVN